MSERNLIVDVYSGDLAGQPNWDAAAGSVGGGIIKAPAGTAYLAGYPSEIAGFGKVDISAVLFDTLRDFQNNCCSQLIKIDS